MTPWPRLAEVTLTDLAGHVPVVLSGSVEESPEVLSDQYQVELPPYGYLWLLFDDSPPSTPTSRS
jgi:maltose alpha-D-glucosyltransferase/alpha-amylase